MSSFTGLTEFSYQPISFLSTSPCQANEDSLRDGAKDGLGHSIESSSKRRQEPVQGCGYSNHKKSNQQHHFNRMLSPAIIMYFL
jgi:hypothetical protein